MAAATSGPFSWRWDGEDVYLNLIADLGYAKELFEALVPLNIKWGGLATTMFAWDEELLDLAARSGCRGILIGFESLSRESLVETHKAFNARRDYHDIVGRIHERGIAIMGCFVFGFDHDTTETYQAVCRSGGQRAGDVKPAALHKMSDWSRRFEGEFLDRDFGR